MKAVGVFKFSDGEPTTIVTYLSKNMFVSVSPCSNKWELLAHSSVESIGIVYTHDSNTVTHLGNEHNIFQTASRSRVLLSTSK